MSDVILCKFESPITGDNWIFSARAEGPDTYVLVLRNCEEVMRTHYSEPWFCIPAGLEATEWDGAQNAYDVVRAATIAALHNWGIAVD